MRKIVDFNLPLQTMSSKDPLPPDWEAEVFDLFPQNDKRNQIDSKQRRSSSDTPKLETKTSLEPEHFTPKDVYIPPKRKVLSFDRQSDSSGSIEVPADRHHEKRELQVAPVQTSFWEKFRSLLEFLNPFDWSERRTTQGMAKKLNIKALDADYVQANAFDIIRIYNAKDPWAVQRLRDNDIALIESLIPEVPYGRVKTDPIFYLMTSQRMRTDVVGAYLAMLLVTPNERHKRVAADLMTKLHLWSQTIGDLEYAEDIQEVIEVHFQDHFLNGHS